MTQIFEIELKATKRCSDSLPERSVKILVLNFTTDCSREDPLTLASGIGLPCVPF